MLISFGCSSSSSFEDCYYTSQISICGYNPFLNDDINLTREYNNCIKLNMNKSIDRCAGVK